MLNETGPAWALVTAFAAVGLVRWSGDGTGEGKTDRTEHTSTATPGGKSMAWLAATLGASLLIGWLLLAPSKLRLYGLDARAGGWTRDYPGAASPSLVFVHGSWQGRLGARLTALGLTSDSVRVALAANPACAVQQALDEGRVRGSLVFRRDRTARPANSSGVSLAPECMRQQAADREAVIGLPQVIWQGDLPGMEPRGAMYVRDMGPRLNRRLLEVFENRTPLMLGLDATGAELVLNPYHEGVRRLWGPDPGAGAAGRD